MGGLIGGFTMTSLGSTLTFRTFAIVAVSTALTFEFVHQLNRLIRCRNSDQLNHKSDHLIRNSEKVSEHHDKEITQPLKGEEIEMTEFSRKNETALESELEPLTSPDLLKNNSV